MPFFSIVTVTWNDAWSLMKTMRSVFEQDCDDFEYLVVDGASADHSQALVGFWQAQGLVDRAVSEPDTGVYNGMNKGLAMARGRFVCFMNAGDVLADPGVLARVRQMLEGSALDGVLGWGELNDQIWASWTENAAFAMASLGFCHQSLFVKREMLLAEPFDERRFKTDSDTLQLGRLYARGAQIAILPEVLAIRGGEAGISADLDRSAASITDTLTMMYPGLTGADAAAILAFRRRGEDPAAILALMARPDTGLQRHLARMVLDTLFQRQSARLAPDLADRITDRALAILAAEGAEGDADVERLIQAQTLRAGMMAARKEAQRDLDRDVAKFEGEETRRIAKVHAAPRDLPAEMVTDPAGPRPVVSLTSFPARLKTVSFAIQSLFEQSCPPAAIHLWLGRDEVRGRNWLPGRLRALEARGLQIHFADRTFHQYDKYLHNAALNADAPFIIVDDDVIYPPHSIAHLLEGHRRHPGAVVANRCHRMILQADGRPAPYRDWPREVHAPAPDVALMPTGAGGVLYPPGFLADPRTVSIPDIFAHAPYADDIWLKFCALAQGLPTFATPLSHKSDWYHRYTPTMRKGSLMSTNVERGLNDVQIARCVAWLDGQNPDWRAGFPDAERAI